MGSGWNILILLCALTACHKSPEATAADPAAAAAARSEPARPPFDVKGNAEGLLLVWFDEHGPHSVSKRDAVPEARRALVRVDSLNIEPEKRLDSAYVYVADLRAAGPDGQYPVQKMPRELFESLVDSAAHPATPPAGAQGGAAHAANGSADVIIYGASWCGACHQAAQYLTSKGIPFIDKDIEQDPSALAEMQQKAAAAGVHPNGIPVIDVRGQLILGFSAQAIDQALAMNPPRPAPAQPGPSQLVPSQPTTPPGSTGGQTL